MSRSLKKLTVATVKIIKGKTHCLQFPFEAISQTEFLSFDQLSQSSHIYLVGETGIPSLHGTVRSTRPPGTPQHHPQLSSTDHRLQRVTQNSHNHPLRRPLGSHCIDEKPGGSEKLRDLPRVHNLLMKNWVAIDFQFSKPRALPHHKSSPQTFGLRHFLQS